MGPYTEEVAQAYKHWLHIERPGELEFIDRYARLKGGPVLELTSGAARVTKELARRGHIVYGVEMSGPMLDKAREVIGRMDAHIQHRIRLVQGDMRRFAFGRTFPLIAIPFCSFWHNLDEEGALECAQCMIRHLAPGGTFLVEGEREGYNKRESMFWRSASEQIGFQYRYEQYRQEEYYTKPSHSFLVGELL